MAPRKPRTAPAEFPYADERVPFFCWLGGNPWYAHKVEDKLTMCRQLASHQAPFRPALLAVWPGKRRSDVFFLNVRKAIIALGGEPATSKV